MTYQTCTQTLYIKLSSGTEDHEVQGKWSHFLSLGAAATCNYAADLSSATIKVWTSALSKNTILRHAAVKLYNCVCVHYYVSLVLFKNHVCYPESGLKKKNRAHNMYLLPLNTTSLTQERFELSYCLPVICQVFLFYSYMLLQTIKISKYFAAAPFCFLHELKKKTTL